MRLLTTALLLAALTGATVSCTQAQQPPPEAATEKEKPKPKPLKVGDAAPAITVQKWLNGSPVDKFEPNKVYVLDFWATWCGPCIQAMPHLAELAREYKDAGLVVFPVTTTNKGNTLKQVEDFVAKRGPKLGVPFAVCETEEMDKAWFEAAGQNGIPCSFVVDKQGKVAFIGHPMELDEVLPMVLDGTWKGEESVKAIKAIDDELTAIQEKSEKDPAAALADLAAFGKKYPRRATGQNYVTTELVLLMQAKKFDEAKAVSERIVADAEKSKKGQLLGLIVGVWTAKELNPERKNLDLVTRAADVMLGLDAQDAMVAYRAARAYSEAGNAARAAELGAKAVELAADDDTKKAIQAAVEKFPKK